MSLSRRLQPLLTRALTHPRAHRLHRGLRERLRRLRREPHAVTFYHRADDPWSYLLVQALPRFMTLYPDVELRCRTIGAPGPGAIPEPTRYATHGLIDARRLARAYDLRAPERSPEPGSVEVAHRQLLDVEDKPAAYLEAAIALGERLFGGETLSGAPAEPQDLGTNTRALHAQGHYLPGVLHYGGEWYWGVDRLEWLEERLCELGIGAGATLERGAVGFEPSPQESPLEVYLSVRSPYSYLALGRIQALRERDDVEVVVKPVLPMVKRGLAVPRSKRFYIVFDANRVAQREGIPFGPICDPLPAVERVLAVYFHLDDPERAFAFLNTMMTAAWSGGADLTRDAVFLGVAERAGVSRAAVEAGWRDTSWEAQTTRHRKELMDEMGVWGVPSFRLGEHVWWGQDRLWMVREALDAGVSSSKQEPG